MTTMPGSLGPFISPVPGQSSEVAANMARGNDNQIGGKVNDVITALTAVDAALTALTATVSGLTVFLIASGVTVGRGGPAATILSPGGAYKATLCWVTGKNGTTDAFVDFVVLQSQAGWAPQTVSSTDTLGASGARTYTNGTGALKLAIAGAAATFDITTAYIQIG